MEMRVGSLPESDSLKVGDNGFAASVDPAASEASLPQHVFLSTLPATARNRSLALVVAIVSAAAFAIVAPLARTPLPELTAFIPAHQSALALCDLITAVLLFGQYSILRLPGVRMLASGYLFTALMVVVHALTFPGVFAPTGLLGAGPQTTAWVYMFWHGGFPLFVIAYARAGTRVEESGAGKAAILRSVAAIALACIACTLVVTQGEALLPPVMSGNRYTPILTAVSSGVWLLSLAALIALWRRKPRSILDLWLMLVIGAWLFDIALGAVLNSARYDLGWYAGRIYGLLSATFILSVLLLEARSLYSGLVHSAETARARAETTTQQLRTANTALSASQTALRTINENLEERVHERAQALAATEQRHRDLVDLMQEAIWIHAEGKILFANPAAVRFFSAGRVEDLVGRPSIGWVHPDDRERAAARTEQLMASPCSVPVTEMRLVALDGKVRTAAVHAVSFQQDGKIHVMASALDVTALREAEGQLHQAQKMETVGQLTGGVAHDFNNLLTVVIGSLDTALEKSPAELRPLLQAALGASERGAALIKKMLAFSRRQMLAPEPLDLSALAEGMEDLLRRTLGEAIAIDMQPDPGLWLALADKSQVESALLNLAINARDAMAPGGKLTIETRNAHLDDDYARTNPEVAPGDYVMLAVTDTGSGMPPEVIERAFEPFFTTKATGKGTGLGLSMIYGFAKQSGGHLKIYSEVDHGTTIRLYLPRHATPAPAVIGTASGDLSRGAGGRETILLVEDDPMVRGLVTTHLRELGYRIIEATEGAAALRFLESRETIDLMLTDVVLPGTLTGRELADAAARLRPNLKVLFSSGYTQSSIDHQGKLDSDVQFLPKPFRRAELAAKVREVLDAPG
jgi:PAS domain S-box-containing protein